jgi:hypothetical protein
MPARRNPSRKKKALLPAVSGTLAMSGDESEKQQNDAGGKGLTNSGKRQHDISDTEEARVNKRARDNNSDLAPSKPTKAKPAPAPCALPSRAHQNEHPGNVVKPRSKRTAAEVAAAKAVKEEKTRQLEELEREKKRILAEIEVDDEDAIEESRAAAIRRLSDMVMAGKDEDYEEYIDAEPMDEDKSEPDSPVPTKALKTVGGLITILNLD